MNRGRVLRLALLLGLTAASVLGYLASSRQMHGLGFPLDDAWIHQTYARSLAARGEWAFQPGQASAGSTAPLWTAALAVGHALGIDPRPWAYLLGGILLLLGALVGQRWLRRRGVEGQVWPWAVGALFVLEWHMAWASVSGMETLAVAVVAMLVLSALDAEAPKWMPIGLAIGLGVWLRPDAVSLLLPAAAAAWLRSPSRAGQRFRDLAALGLGSAFLVGPYLAFNWLLSGEIWPSTFYAKQAEYAALRQVPLVGRMLAQLGLPLVGPGALLSLGVGVVVWHGIRARLWIRLAPVGWALVFLGGYALRLPVTYQHGRYAMATIPVMIVLGVEGFARWAQPRSESGPRRIVSRVGLATLAAVTAVFWALGGQAYARDVAIIETEMVTAARWIADHTEADALVAAHDIGALGYFGQRRMIDLAGLVSPEVIPILREEAALDAYLDSRQADYLMTFPGWYPELTRDRTPIFVTAGRFSPEVGGENMAVYRWDASGFARPLAAVLYFAQPKAVRVAHGNHWSHHR